MILDEGKPMKAEAIGEPVLVRVTPNGSAFPDFSERVRRYAEAMAPPEANAYVVGRNGTITNNEEKAEDWLQSGRWETKKAIAHPVQFYKI